MRKVSMIGVCVFGAAALLGGSVASASIWVATYTGTVYNSLDFSGEFGTIHLNGLAFTARYTYNTALPKRDIEPGVDSLYGGPVYGWKSPVRATLTINGVTQHIAATYDGQVVSEIGWMAAEVTTNIDLTNPFIFNYAYPAGANANLDASLPLSSAGDAPGGFKISSPGHYAMGSFDDTAVQVSPAVPEPAAWTLMLVGFGGLGLAFRSRRRSATATA